MATIFENFGILLLNVAMDGTAFLQAYTFKRSTPNLVLGMIQ